jgi:hypothetical protein
VADHEDLSVDGEVAYVVRQGVERDQSGRAHVPGHVLVRLADVDDHRVVEARRQLGDGDLRHGYRHAGEAIGRGRREC